jgi:hypothetical protein
MLVLFCVQVMQTNNNESNWRKKEKNNIFLVYTSKRFANLPKINKKILI